MIDHMYKVTLKIITWVLGYFLSQVPCCRQMWLLFLHLLSQMEVEIFIFQPFPIIFIFRLILSLSNWILIADSSLSIIHGWPRRSLRRKWLVRHFTKALTNANSIYRPLQRPSDIRKMLVYNHTRKRCLFRKQRDGVVLSRPPPEPQRKAENHFITMRQITWSDFLLMCWFERKLDAVKKHYNWVSELPYSCMTNFFYMYEFSVFVRAQDTLTGHRLSILLILVLLFLSKL